MVLIERARQFIEEGDADEFWALLLDCVANRNAEGMLAVKLLAGDMYGGMTFNWELKAPAAYCLLAWREDGLKALVENAVEEPSLRISR